MTVLSYYQSFSSNMMLAALLTLPRLFFTFSLWKNPFFNATFNLGQTHTRVIQFAVGIYYLATYVKSGENQILVCEPRHTQKETMVVAENPAREGTASQ
jgi:hypothetical protein